MRIGYTGWTWLVNHKDGYRWEFEQFLKAAADLGYEAVENFAFILDYFDGDAAPVKDLLARYGLALVNLYQHLSDNPAKDFEDTKRYVRFMRGIGATHLNLQAAMWNEAPLNRPTDAARVRYYAEAAGHIGAYCAEHGITACFHPHANTHVFTEGEIDMLLDETDPRSVSLCPDTAHLTLAGMDVVHAFERYLPRIGYVHLKDVDPDPIAYAAWPMDSFCELGLGTVDFRGVHRVLTAGGYDGVLCVELDKPRVSGYKSAMVSRRYLRDAMAL